MNWRIQKYARVDSTMNLGADLPVGSVVVADEQTAGIGRHGHDWESQPGAGLYCSIVLPPSPMLTLALGLAAHNAILQVTLLRCDIRWPNDLMLSRKKIGGILVQMHEDRAVAGIGLNIGQRGFAPELVPIATSFAMETNLEFRRDDFLDALLDSIPLAVGYSTEETVRRWEEVSSWAKGKPVSVDLGTMTMEGTTDGLDAQGFLRLRRGDGGIETVVAGSVREI